MRSTPPSRRLSPTVCLHWAFSRPPQKYACTHCKLKHQTKKWLRNKWPVTHSRAWNFTSFDFYKGLPMQNIHLFNLSQDFSKYQYLLQNWWTTVISSIFIDDISVYGDHNEVKVVVHLPGKTLLLSAAPKLNLVKPKLCRIYSGISLCHVEQMSNILFTLAINQPTWLVCVFSVHIYPPSFL